LWDRPQDDDLTTAFENTRTNWSKHKVLLHPLINATPRNFAYSNVLSLQMCFTDFVHEDQVGLHPTWSDMQSLLHRYADAFDLRAKIRFGTKVKLIDLLEKEKEDEEDQYEVTFEEKGVEGEQKVVVNRVAVCTGLQGTVRLTATSVVLHSLG
jgi:cation diffusion facilitator CzcD-associated flavoprotein CzcO